MKMKLTELVRMMDLSAVRADSDETEVRAMAEWARKYQCVAVFALPALTPLLCELLAGEQAVAVGGVVGFPSGGVTTATKAREAAELLGMGCRELDMVINVGLLRSSRHDEVRADIRAVVDTAGRVPVKVITRNGKSGPGRRRMPSRRSKPKPRKPWGRNVTPSCSARRIWNTGRWCKSPSAINCPRRLPARFTK